MGDIDPPSSSGITRETIVPPSLAFTCAVTAARGPRDSMEDTHLLVAPFAGIHGQGLFAVFDGHGGKEAASWCRSNYNTFLVDALEEHRNGNVIDALKSSFVRADEDLERIWLESGGKEHSGTTAVVAFLRLEDDKGRQSFAPTRRNPLERVHNAFMPPPDVRRVLYCANVGDARAVLGRGGKATRLTYDHAVTDGTEAARVEEAGAVIEDGRVDGVLIPTRALGDANMNQYISSVPHTTKVELDEEDEILILACDGLWDVVNDQEAVDIVHGVQDSMEAAQRLVEEARRRKTQDNVTILVVRLRDAPNSGNSRSKDL
ncbi:protein serine/threonine phosphatase 2C [Trametes maxima]|nr:protein serine/threonine phosphatase 2C [Trametes maxima]